MHFTHEVARKQSVTPADVIGKAFGGLLGEPGATANGLGEMAELKLADAVFLNAGRSAVLGVAGLPYKAPVGIELLNQPVFCNYIKDIDGSVLIVTGDHCKAFSACNEDCAEHVEPGAAGGSGWTELELPLEVSDCIADTVARVLGSVGQLNERGELIIDLKSCVVGTHYPINLLLGDRSKYALPLITTPKSAVDAFGRGSFRATGDVQVLATRYVIHPEENGEPANRQFYLTEGGRQIFYSADVHNNVRSAFCCHSQNRTTITYQTEDNLEITRTIFLLPQEDGLPNATEVQRITVCNLSDRARDLRIVATGVFGLLEAEKLSQDVIYGNLVLESEICYDGGKPVALTTHAKPAQDEYKKRFVMLIASSAEADHSAGASAGTMEEFCTNNSEFIGNGTLERPEHVGKLSSVLHRKMASFFAVGKSFRVESGQTATIDEFVGMCDSIPMAASGGSRDVQEAGGEPSTICLTPDYDEAIWQLYERFSDPARLTELLADMDKNWEDYTSYITPETGDEMFDSYVRWNLPFQVLYQTYVSRAFAWTQKAYREIGFREIQDIFASMYYLCASGQSALVKELLGNWIGNVFSMGYANHNFTFRGKEPGDCSDDQLWLLQAVYRYVKLTGDTGILSEEYPVAGENAKRSLMETIRAILTYSGKISVGKHGLPLLDKADWNDTLRLDKAVFQGPEKELLYLEQLVSSKQEYGAPWDNELCESVMNACLLRIAAFEAEELAVMVGDEELEAFAGRISADTADRVQEFAWKGDFFARCLINDDREYTYLGAGGDGLSLDPGIDGSYFLNSYSWAILADIATEEQIRVMLGTVNKYLRTEAGLKLCTLVDFDKLGVQTGTALYFPGDRENSGVFKHAAMMATVASLRAAKTVSDPALAEDLRELAFFMIDKTLPYCTLKDPFVLKGNPRFCTQYNNSETGENIGPMLSGTASWLTLAVYEHFGLEVGADRVKFSPVLRPGTESLKYSVKLGKAFISVEVTGSSGRFRPASDSVYTLNGEPFSGEMKLPESGEWNIKILL